MVLLYHINQYHYPIKILTIQMPIPEIRKYCNTVPILKKVLAILPIKILYCNINNPAPNPNT